MIKKQSVVRLFVVCSLLSMLMACATPTAPHENFKEHMQFNVGKKESDSSSYLSRYSDDVLAREVLPNGNIEVEFLISDGARGDCVVFFEIDKETNIIINWRFEGSEKDCVIVP